MAARWIGSVRWLVVYLVVFGSAGLVLAAVAAPALEAHRSPLAPSLYAFLGQFCHQRPSRSWFLMGSNLGLCARTFSLYATIALAGLLALRSRSTHGALRCLPALAILALAAPLVVDGLGQLVGLWTSTNARRGLTGVLAGVGVLRLLLPPLAPGPTRLAVGPALRRASAAATAVALVGASFAVPAPAAAQNGRTTLKAGTPVFLVFPDVLSSQTAVEGQTVPLRVTYDVKVGDAVVIAAGARASAKVTHVQRPAGWGQPGSLTVYVSDVEAVDGQNVPLSATQQGRGQDSQTSAAVTGIIAGLLCLPSALWGFAIKGEEGRIAPGTELKAFTEVEALVALRVPRPLVHPEAVR